VVAVSSMVMYFLRLSKVDFKVLWARLSPAMTAFRFEKRKMLTSARFSEKMQHVRTSYFT
jgi:hypothetical protein